MPNRFQCQGQKPFQTICLVYTKISDIRYFSWRDWIERELQHHAFKSSSRPKNQTHVCSKPVRASFFCWTQMKMFQGMLVTKQLTVAIDFHSMEKNGYQQKVIPKCKYHALSMNVPCVTLLISFHKEEVIATFKKKFRLFNSELRIWPSLKMNC